MPVEQNNEISVTVERRGEKVVTIIASDNISNIME